MGNIYDGTSAILNSVIPNPDLKWEQSKTFDIGADIGLLNNRIGILFDYYRRVTDNLITSLSLPPSTGFASIYTNLGRLENKGIELEVNAAVLPAWSGLQWNVAMTATHTKHKILRLPENGAENNRIGGEYVWVPSKKDYAWMGGLQEGGRVGDIYGHVLEGVYATDEEAQNDPVVNTLIPGNDKTKYGGYAKFRDVDGNGQIDSKDKVYLGNFYPTWNGGFTNSFSFRGLTFSVRFDYTLGHKIYNYATRFMDNNSQGDGNLTKNMAKNSWKQQGDQASMPCYIWNQSYNLPVNCNIYVEKGDFLCLREMTLAYELPKRLLRKIGLAGVRTRIKHHDSMPVLVILANKICDVLFCRLWSCPGGFRFFLRHNGIKLFVGILFLFARGLNTIQNLLQFLLSFFFRQRGRVNVLLLLILPLCLSQLQVETIEWPALLFITHIDPRLLF